MRHLLHAFRFKVTRKIIHERIPVQAERSAFPYVRFVFVVVLVVQKQAPCDDLRTDMEFTT
jgi:hypothetical protein